MKHHYQPTMQEGARPLPDTRHNANTEENNSHKLSNTHTAYIFITMDTYS